MDVKIKKLDPKAVIPKYAKPGDAGMDLIAISYKHDDKYDYHVYGTGLVIEIPEGYVGLLFPRSSNRKTDAYMTNHVGVIDSGYRGEIMITYKTRFDCSDEYDRPYNEGDRVAQLIIMPYPTINLVEVEELSETERGEGGHGSTGK